VIMSHPERPAYLPPGELPPEEFNFDLAKPAVMGTTRL